MTGENSRMLIVSATAYGSRDPNRTTQGKEKAMRKISKKMKCKFLIPFVVAAFTALLSPPLASADAILGSNLASFAVLGAETVTNVPASTIKGNVGVSAGTALPGFTFTSGLATADPQVTSGLVHSNTAVAAAAQAELTTARTSLGSLGAGTLLPANLVGLTILPGVYTVPFGTTNLSGTVTLDGLGNPNALWVFQMTSSLITSSGSKVVLADPNSGAGVFWNVGSSATLNTTTEFQGNILALTSVWLRNGATIGCGSALAENGEVVLDTNTIGIGCGGGTELAFVPPPSGGGLGTVIDTTGGGDTVVSGGGPAPTGGSAPVPEPGTMMLLGSGLVGLVGWGRKKLRK